jgi:hypothetical protein
MQYLHQKTKVLVVVGVFGAIHACEAQNIHPKGRKKRKRR